MDIINLKKGQRLDIELRRLSVGLGWDPAETGQDFDLDASAFLLGKNRRTPNEKFFVYYYNRMSPDNAVTHLKDDRTGGDSEGDDETLTVDLELLDSRITEIVFTVTIDEYKARKQNFGQVRNAFIRIYEPKDEKVICKYELDEDFSMATAVEFGRLYLREGTWRFEAAGRPFEGGLRGFVERYTDAGPNIVD